MKTVDDVLRYLLIENTNEMCVAFNNPKTYIAKNILSKAKFDLLRIILEALPKEKRWDEMTVDTRNDFNWGYESALADVRKKVEEVLK